MDYSSKALKGAMGNMDVDKVDDMMADIQESQDVSNEIAEAIARPMGMQVSSDLIFEAFYHVGGCNNLFLG